MHAVLLFPIFYYELQLYRFFQIILSDEFILFVTKSFLSVDVYADEFIVLLTPDFYLLMNIFTKSAEPFRKGA